MRSCTACVHRGYSAGEGGLRLYVDQARTQYRLVPVQFIGTWSGVSATFLPSPESGQFPESSCAAVKFTSATAHFPLLHNSFIMNNPDGGFAVSALVAHCIGGEYDYIYRVRFGDAGCPSWMYMLLSTAVVEGKTDPPELRTA